MVGLRYCESWMDRRGECTVLGLRYSWAGILLQRIEQIQEGTHRLWQVGELPVAGAQRKRATETAASQNGYEFLDLCVASCHQGRLPVKGAILHVELNDKALQFGGVAFEEGLFANLGEGGGAHAQADV